MKNFIFNYDPENEGMFMLSGIDMFKPTYRKEEKYEDEYTISDLRKWRDYINVMTSYGKKIYVLVHHEGGTEKPLYAGYLNNMRIEEIDFPVRGKNDLFAISKVPALIGDILGIPLYIKEWIMEGGLPGRSLSFRPKKDKKSQKFFDEVSHLALLTPEETPFIKFRDLNAQSIEDLTTEQQKEIEQPVEALNFSELNVVRYEISELSQVAAEKNFSNIPDNLQSREANELKAFENRQQEKYIYIPINEADQVDSLAWRIIRGMPITTQQQNFDEEDDDISDEDFNKSWAELIEDSEFQKNFAKWQIPKVTPDMRRLIGQLIKRGGLDRKQAVAAAYEAEHKGLTSSYHYSESDPESNAEVEKINKSFAEEVLELFAEKKVAKDFSEELEKLFPDKPEAKDFSEELEKLFPDKPAAKDFYDPSQPRDKDGKFASSGGGGGSAKSDLKSQYKAAVKTVAGEQSKFEKKKEKRKFDPNVLQNEWDGMKRIGGAVSKQAKKLAAVLESKGVNPKVAITIAYTSSVLVTTPVSVTTGLSGIGAIGAWGATPGLAWAEASVLCGGAVATVKVKKSVKNLFKKVFGKKEKIKDNETMKDLYQKLLQKYEQKDKARWQKKKALGRI
jgi:hypothetical protein